tara:strand:+ start:608 stop:2272 length:1665 start_codon:yes stop_codon:yes gene_type:complete
MPKIPLYQSQSRIGTAQGVKVNTSVVNRLMDAQAAESQSLITGVANVMQETLNAGQEYLDKRKENKTKADKNLMQLAEIDVDLAIQQKRNELIDQGKDESYIFNEIVNNDFANNWLQEYVKDNKIEMTDDLQQRWDLKTKSIETNEYIKYAKFEEERNIQADNLFVGRLLREGKREEAIAYAEENIIGEERKQKLLGAGMHDYYAYQMQEADSIEEIQGIVKTFENDEYLTFAGLNSLRLRIASAEKSFYSNKASPLLKELDAKNKDNQLLPEMVEDANISDIEKKRLKGDIANKSKLMRQDTFVNPNLNQVLDSDGKQMLQGITGSYFLSDILTEKVDNLLRGETEDFSDALDEIYTLANSTDEEGNVYFPPMLKAQILKPIMNVMADENRNGIFLTTPELNTYNEVEKKAIMFLREQFSKISATTAERKVEGFYQAFTMVNEFLDTIRDNPTVIYNKDKKTGKETFYSYEDNIMDIVDKALKNYGVKVSEQVRKEYYKKSQEQSNFVNRILLAPVFDVTGGQVFQEDEELINSVAKGGFDQADEIFRPKIKK